MLRTPVKSFAELLSHHCVKMGQLSPKYLYSLMTLFLHHNDIMFIRKFSKKFLSPTWASDFSCQSLPLQYLACQHPRPKNVEMKKSVREKNIKHFWPCFQKKGNSFTTFAPLCRFVSFWSSLRARLRSFRARSTDLNILKLLLTSLTLVFLCLSDPSMRR